MHTVYYIRVQYYIIVYIIMAVVSNLHPTSKPDCLNSSQLLSLLALSHLMSAIHINLRLPTPSRLIERDRT